MELEKFSSEIRKEADMELSELQVGKFYKYMNLLQEWNNKINLTAIIEPSDIILKHFIDSMSILKYINKQDKIIDVGTGAGFPGIPIQIINQNSKVVLLDSLNKRIKFLDNVIENLNLKNIETIHMRAEECGRLQKYREQFDVAVSRAVAPMNILLEYLLPMVKVGGKCICMKGPEIDEELKNCTKALEILGGKIEKIEKINLANTNNRRTIIIVRKNKKTPNKYPRNAGTPSKTPI